jgi:chitin disaccharide deacetylase
MQAVEEEPCGGYLPSTVSPLLIVNADDLGLDRKSTDAILECFAKGRITSATAMVWMADSERASGASGEAALPVGLHLNLSEPYTSADVPAAARERQARLASRFSGRWLRLRRWIFDPALRSDVETCISEQLDAFRTLYGYRPTHVDGHNHLQVSPNVLLAGALPRGTLLRGPLEAPSGVLASAPRAARRWLQLRRFPSTDYCFDFAERERALELARRAAVELVVHPALRDREALLSERWGRDLGSVQLGSFADLEADQQRASTRSGPEGHG